MGLVTGDGIRFCQAGAIDERRLREAVASTERTLSAHGITLEPEAKADAIAAVYDLLDCERAPATAARVKQLIEALGRAAIDELSPEALDPDSPPESASLRAPVGCVVLCS